MNPWFENSANVPTHSIGVLCEKTLTPNKKHRYYTKSLELGGKDKGSDIHGSELKEKQCESAQRGFQSSERGH